MTTTTEVPRPAIPPERLELIRLAVAIASLRHRLDELEREAQQ